jgi:flagellar hook-length control protein FliK
MDNPQDLMKLVPPSPGGKSVSRSPADGTRKPEGGAEFAEAMRSAQETNRPEPREADSREPQVRDAQGRPVQDARSAERQSRETAADPAEAPTRAREAEPAQAETSTASAADNAQAAQTQPAGNGTATNPAAPPQVADSLIAMAAGVALPASMVTPTAAGPQVVSPVTGDSQALAPRTVEALQGAQALADMPATRPVTTSGFTVLPTSDGSLAESRAPVQQTAVASSLAQVALGQDSASRLIGVTEPDAQGLPNDTLTAAESVAVKARAVAMAPASVALAVDRAIGNALVNQPATGHFKPADLAAPQAADPARIASTGFVAAALQTAEASDAPALPLPMGEPLPPGQAPATSNWLTTRPDSLAMTLADRALMQDPVAQAPIELEQLVRSLDTKLASVVGVAVPQEEVLSLSANAGASKAAAAVEAPLNGALQLPGLGAPVDNAPEPVALSLNAPLQQAGRWASELGDRVAWVANNRLTAATLQVNPPQLGPIEVRIQISGDQAAVSFAAVQPQTREAIQQALPVLASSLASQGLSLGQASVGRDHLPQQGGQGGSGGNSSARSGPATTVADAVGNVTSGMANRGDNGLVDTFA